MTLPVKVGGVALTLATISGLSGVGSAYMSDKKAVNNTQQGTAISKIIEDQFDYILLRTEGPEDNTHWNTNWNNYKNDNQDKGPKEDTFELDDWVEGDRQDLNLVEQLKRKCSELSGSIVYDGGQALYDNVTKYCGRSVTIADEAAKLNLRTINVKGEYDTWVVRSNRRAALKKELDALKVVEQDNAYKVREACENVVTKKRKDDGYAEVLEAYKIVCAKQASER